MVQMAHVCSFYTWSLQYSYLWSAIASHEETPKCFKTLWLGLFIIRVSGTADVIPLLYNLHYGQMSMTASNFLFVTLHWVVLVLSRCLISCISRAGSLRPFLKYRHSHHSESKVRHVVEIKRFNKISDTVFKKFKSVACTYFLIAFPFPNYRQLPYAICYIKLHHIQIYVCIPYVFVSVL